MDNNILEIENIEMLFGSFRALDGSSFKIVDREIRGLIGPNGAGKTTLINVISGVYKPNKGRIFFKKEDITGLAPNKIAEKGIVRTFQIPKLYTKMTVWENLFVTAKDENNFDKQALELLEIAGLQEFKDEYTGVLTYGQQKYLAMIRALLILPSLFLLDEPTAGLNFSEKEKMMELIHRFNKKFEVSFLIIEHDMDIIKGHCSTVNVLNNGRIIAEGTYEDIKNDEKVKEAYFGKEKE